MSPLPPSILALADKRSALVERLTTWSAINSGSTHLPGLARMADLLEAALRELTPHLERLPLAADGRVALRAHLRPEAPIRIICSGHYDTVFGADHPFQTARVLASNRLNGPGVADMKGGIVTMLAALTAFEQTPAAANLGWTILLTPDEEIGSEVSRPVIEATADSHHLALVFEPARDSGDMVKSRSATGVFDVTVHGRAAHAGRDPAAGRNAILALAEFCLAVDTLPASIPNLLVNIGQFAGGGAVNIVPDLAHASINARASTAEAMQTFNEAIAHLATQTNNRDGYRLELTGQFNRDPLASTPLTEALFAQLQSCGRDLALAPFSWQAVAGGSDGNLLHGVGLPVLDGLGPIGGALHSDQEYLEIPSLTQRAQLAALFLHRLATKEIAL
jgi:glutamate carboxypeptidase